MWKKILWVFLGIYCAAILYLNIMAIVNSSTGGSWLNTLLSLVVMLFPAAVIAFELRGKKVPFVIILAAFLIIAVFFLGTVKFNTPGIETGAKAALFGILILLLGYFGTRRILKK